MVIYPLTLADIYSDAIRKQTENASSVELTLEDTLPGKPPKGLVFITSCVAIVPTIVVLLWCNAWFGFGFGCGSTHRPILCTRYYASYLLLITS